jgi:glyoxylase-like metal-dependent hydrolase (beta-lactamase superfamily II)
MGAQIRFSQTKRFWIAHFTFVKDRSLEGARHLETIYKRDGKIAKDALPLKRRVLFAVFAALLIGLVILGSRVGWFYAKYVRLMTVQVAPGVTAVLGGGGNSLLVHDGNDLLLVDSKFPPGSIMLRHKINELHVPVNIIINTHYHYDHTQGNIEYPQAKIYAYHTTPALMRLRDGDWWSRHPGGIPTNLVGESGIIRVGSQEVLMVHPGNAHTHSDLYVYLQRHGQDVVATGDVMFNTYYPMMDLGEGGMDLQGLIDAVRELAAKYPDAIFVPGHGPIANAHDLMRYGNYLQFLRDSITQARQDGLTEDQAARSIDLSTWRLTRLPTFHDNHLCWSTPEMNIRWTYQLEAGTRLPRQDCTF